MTATELARLDAVAMAMPTTPSERVDSEQKPGIWLSTFGLALLIEALNRDCPAGCTRPHWWRAPNAPPWRTKDRKPYEKY